MNNQQQYSNQNFFAPSNFNNMPNNEVNWAQLAQRWIHHTQQQAQQPYPYTPQQMTVPTNFNQNTNHNYPIVPPSSSSTGGFFTQPPLVRPPIRPPNQQWNRAPWIQPPSYLPPFPTSGMMMPPHSYQTGPSFTGNYTSNANDNSSSKQEEEEYQAHYDPSLEQDEGFETGEQQSQISEAINAIPEGAMSHWMADPMWAAAAAGVYTSNYMPVIDTQMRKKLPAWILEGLEKAEKEKQKKLEKEEQEKRQKEHEEALRKKREEKGLGKFDSDSDNEDEQNETKAKLKEAVESTKSGNISMRRFREFVDNDDEKNDNPLIDERSEEERRAEAVFLMRRLMTSVLLDATNREFERIAEKMIARAKIKAQPKILVQSSALAALSAFSDDEEDERSLNNDEGSVANKSNLSPKKVTESIEHSAPEQADKPKESSNTSTVFKVPLAPQPKSGKEMHKLASTEPEEKLDKNVKNERGERDEKPDLLVRQERDLEEKKQDRV